MTIADKDYQNRAVTIFFGMTCTYMSSIHINFSFEHKILIYLALFYFLIIFLILHLNALHDSI
jgi:hypothetical protein